MGVWIGDVFAAALVLTWFSTFVHGLMLLPHRRDDISLGALLVGGWRMYRADTWKPSGRALHRRFLLSAGAFTLVVVAGAISGILASR